MRYLPYVLSALLLTGCASSQRRPTASPIERCLEIGQTAQDVFADERYRQIRQEVLDDTQLCVEDALNDREKEERIDNGLQTNFDGHYATFSGWETLYPNGLTFSRHSSLVFEDRSFHSITPGMGLGTEWYANRARSVGFYIRYHQDVEVRLTIDSTTSVTASTDVDVNDMLTDSIPKQEIVDASSSTDAQTSTSLQLGGIDAISRGELGLFFEAPRIRFSVSGIYSYGVGQGMMPPMFGFYVTPRLR